MYSASGEKIGGDVVEVAVRYGMRGAGKAAAPLYVGVSINVFRYRRYQERRPQKMEW